MASPSVMRAALTSPARATFARSSLKVPRSILKRPAPLALSPNPFPFSSSITIETSPANSPHVHFPPSPTLFAMFTAHSPGTYDRAPIIVSPNPLALPDWGDRIYSPTLNGFKGLGAPQPFPMMSMSIYNSPTVPGFEDPRSPKPNVAKQRMISFAPPPSGRRSQELAKALSKYPRSPYPSAPLSPAEFEDPGGEEVTRGRTQYRERGDMIKNLPARARARAKSLEEERKQKRQVTPASNAAPRQFKSKSGLLSPFMPAPSPLSQTFMAASQEPTLARANKPAPLPLMVEPVSSNLSMAFWQSVSLEDSESMPSPAFPESVSGSEGSAEEFPNRREEHLMFANKDGALWSPRVVHEPAAGSLLSPAQKVAFKNMTKSMVASPSPNDPFAAFPSFSVVLSTSSGAEPSITYPPRVKVGRASERV